MEQHRFYVVGRVPMFRHVDVSYRHTLPLVLVLSRDAPDGSSQSPTTISQWAPDRDSSPHAGELLLEMEKNRGQLHRGCTIEPRGDEPTYADLGVKKHRAIRMQQAGLVGREDRTDTSLP